MCIVVAKHFKEFGWTVTKNRDQDYVPDVNFVDEKHKAVGEVLVMYDKTTGYKEGMNHEGVGIITTSLTPLISLETNNKDGKLIDNALGMKDPKKAASYLEKNKLTGYIFIFSKDKLFLIEAARKEDGKGKYESTMREVPKDEVVVRTNHGIDLPWAGFQEGVSERQDIWCKSSKIRMEQGEKIAAKAKTPFDVLAGLASKVNDDLQMNLFRVAIKDRQMRTIFQTLYVPSEKKMYMVPIQCRMTLDTDREFIHTEVLDNSHIKKIFGRKLKHFAKIEKHGDVVKCVEESFIPSFKQFIS